MLFSKNQGPPAPTESGDGWLAPQRFVLLLAVLVLASWPQVFSGLQTFIYRDFGFFSYPIAQHFRESFWRGEIPLWNSLNSCGTPFLAQWNTQVLYPPALFYLLLPLSWSLGVFCLLHLFLGGLGMYFLVRHWTHNSFAAAFAGIVFAFNGLMLNSLMWPATIPGLGWMPWVVWLTEQAWREGGRKVFIAALVGALQMLSGAVEVIFFTWALLGVLGLVAICRGNSFKIFLRTTAVVALICGLSAAQLLPFFDLLHYSRQQENISASLWPMPATGWLNFFVPLFHCQSFQGGFMQDNQYWTSSYYVGVITMALAFWALCRGRDLVVWLLAALTLFSLVLALGNATPIYTWLARHVSFIGSMRFPVKFVILPVFLLPLLAACGLANQQANSDEKNLRFNRAWGLVCVFTIALIAGILWWNHRSPPPGEDFVTVNGLLRAAFFTAIVLGMFFVGKISQPKSRRAVQILLLLLVWFDLYREAPQPPTVSRTVFQTHLRNPTSAPRFGTDRAMIPPSVRSQFVTAFLPDLTADYISRRFALSMNCNLLDDIPKCDGFFPLDLHDTVAVLSHDLPDPLLDFVGASEIITVQSNNFFWQTRSNFMPLLTGGQKPVFAGDAETLQKLAQPDFNPRVEVYLPLTVKNSIAATNATAVKITEGKFSDQKIEATVEADAPAILVAAQINYPPWHAYVDGRPVPVQQANYAFQALEVPAGSHHVKLVYEDRKFYFGAALSLITLTGCLIGLGRRTPAKI